MNNISIYFVGIVLLIFSCGKSSKLDSQEVKSKLDSINRLNNENRFNESLIILKSLDSLYPTDTKIKERYVELLKETSLKRAKYNIEILDDSIRYIDSCIESASHLYKGVGVLNKLDTDRGDCYMLSSSIGYNSGSGFSIRVNMENAVIDIISKLTSNKKQDYQQIKIIDRGNNNSWLSEAIPYDNATNYRYSILGKWVQTINFEVTNINEFIRFANTNFSNNVYILFLNTNQKIVASKKLTQQDIDSIRAIAAIQLLVAKSCKYKKELDLSKKTINRLS